MCCMLRSTSIGTRKNWDADVGYEQEYGARGGYFEGVQQPFEIMVSFPVRL